MDEPLSNLDAKLRVLMRAELKRLHHDLGTTVVYVTHDQVEAMTLASRVAVMEGGRIVQLDVPEAIYARPADRFVAGFVGSPPMSFLTVVPSPQGPTIADQPVALSVGDRPVVLGVRPEDVEVTGPGEGDLRATVFAVEFTGAVTYATVTLGAEHVLATCPAGRPAPYYDEKVGLRLNRARLHVFDPATGARIGS
jgi:multiple sugar transport system ATP-binding protein